MALLTSRKTIRQRVLRELGGLVATVASGSTESSIVLSELENRFADDNALKNWRLLLPDDAAADQQHGEIGCSPRSWSKSSGSRRCRRRWRSPMCTPS